MMHADEWIVEVDEDDGIVGRIGREPAHGEGRLKLHREVMTLLYTDPERKQFLLQHRSMKKAQLPGYWTLSVTGHVDWEDISDEDREGYLSAAKREAKEEIGAEAVKLTLRGKLVQKTSDNWAMMGIVEGELEGEIRLDPNEVIEVKIFDKETLIQVSDKLTPGAKACL